MASEGKIADKKLELEYKQNILRLHKQLLRGAHLSPFPPAPGRLSSHTEEQLVKMVQLAAKGTTVCVPSGSDEITICAGPQWVW